MKKIKVLIIDDSALVRQVLTQVLTSVTDIDVIGTAADPFIAREKIKQLNPDVLTLDVEMPKMDGVTFLGNLMRLRPMPVVMISTLTEKGADVTLRALENGAVDYISKPKLDVAEGLKEYTEEIITKVRMAAKARVRALERKPKASAEVVAAKAAATSAGHFKTTDKIIGIGSSTGGTEALKDVLSLMPMDLQAGVVISQHIPAAFSEPFANRLNNISAMSVMQARDGQQILAGHAYVAPGDRHLTVVRDGARYIIRLDDGAPVNRHKPSVDVMLRSMVENVGNNAIACMLTGMGADGAAGMGELKAKGVPIIIQDEASSVVWGMPGEVFKRGFADEVLPLSKIGPRLVELV